MISRLILLIALLSSIFAGDNTPVVKNALDSRIKSSIDELAEVAEIDSLKPEDFQDSVLKLVEQKYYLRFFNSQGQMIVPNKELLGCYAYYKGLSHQNKNLSSLDTTPIPASYIFKNSSQYFSKKSERYICLVSISNDYRRKSIKKLHEIRSIAENHTSKRLLVLMYVEGKSGETHGK